MAGGVVAAEVVQGRFGQRRLSKGRFGARRKQARRKQVGPAGTRPQQVAPKCSAVLTDALSVRRACAGVAPIPRIGKTNSPKEVSRGRAVAIYLKNQNSAQKRAADGGIRG